MRFWQGSTFDQLVRRCQCPVLVVTREPSRRYGRVLVAVRVSDESRELVRYACAFDVESELELFHSQSTLHETTESRCHAEDRLVRLSESLGPTRYRVRTSVGHGDPSRQTKSELLRHSHRFLELALRPSTPKQVHARLELGERRIWNLASQVRQMLLAKVNEARVVVMGQAPPERIAACDCRAPVIRHSPESRAHR